MANRSRADRSVQKARRLPRAVPPPDNPQARAEERVASRLAGEEDLQLLTLAEGVRVAVTEAAMAEPPTRPRRAAQPSPRARMAALRLQALVDAGRIAPGGPDRPAPGGGGPGGGGAGGLMPTMAAVPGASNWVQLGPTAIPKGQTYSSARVLVSGRVTVIAVDPTNRDVIYLGAAQGGVWKSTDRGDHWSATSDNEASMAIGALVIDPNDHQTLYAGTGEGNFAGDSYYGAGVLRSVNAGASWTLLGQATFTGARMSRVAVTPGTATRIFAATGIGLYRSTDTGGTWAQMSGTPATACTDVSIDPANPATVIASFWGGALYRSTNAGSATPTWALLAGGLPSANITRVALGRSPSNSQVLFALMAGPWDANPSLAYLVNQLYRSGDGGTTWTAIALPGGGNIGTQGFYNLNVAVDPTTPDVVYLSGISLWKGARNAATNTWVFTDIGGGFHPDNHALAFDPTDHLTVYAGSDGGIYRSIDGGTSWDDGINRDLCVAQFEFIAQHPTSDAVVLAGTQDNGTEQFRNSPVFYHSDDGDGGFCLIDQNQPRNFLSTYYGNSPKRSTQAGRYGSWLSVAPGIAGPGLFYPPMAADQTNPANLAFGTNQVNLDSTQGTGSWPTKVALPGLAANELVSALCYANSSLIYAGTTQGKVFRLVAAGGAWTATAIAAAPLPSRFIWDISILPGNPSTVFVIMSGFGTGHIWRGVIPAAGATVWTNVSGSAPNALPDIPANALVVDPAAPNSMYVATDVAVHRTLDGGANWSVFSEGLPNVAVFDMALHGPRRLLRVGTHGRGMWERQLDTLTAPDVRLFVRDHLMDTGRQSPSPSNVPSAFDDPLQGVSLGDALWWWQCADIKVDAQEGFPPSYQMAAGAVDYVAFESALAHRNAQRGRVNRIYVQVHNQGISPAANVAVKVLWADASAGLPALPADFWTAFPGDSTNTANWHPVGAAQTIASLPSYLPTVLEWDWTTPVSAAQHSCLLVVVDSASDPIPNSSKGTDVNSIVQTERRVGLKNLHVVDAPPGAPWWTELRLFGLTAERYALRVMPHRARTWSISFLLPRSVKPEGAGFEVTRPSAGALEGMRKELGKRFELFDSARLYRVASPKGARLDGFALDEKAGASVIVLFGAPERGTTPQTITVVQESAKGVVGGSTYVLKTAKGQ